LSQEQRTKTRIVLTAMTLSVVVRIVPAALASSSVILTGWVKTWIALQVLISARYVNRRAELAGLTPSSATISIRDGDRWGLTHLAVPPLSLLIECGVAFPFDQLPKRYRIDKNGRRVLIGLSIEETFEFETLDDLAPTGGLIAWREGVPITSREKRWLELYQKHDGAWKELFAKRVADTKRK
jgi:hypothetical protein